MLSRINRLGRAAVAAIMVTAAPAWAESLPQTLADAYRNSQLLEQNRFLLRVEDENLTQAVAALFPVVDFTSSATRNLTNDTLTSTASLVAQLGIYQGGQRRAAIDAAQDTVEATRQRLINLEQQVLFDAASAYLNVWRDAQIVAVRESNVRVITQQLRAARDRFEVGEDTRTDVAQAEANLAAARSNLAAAQGSLEISRELFALVVGRHPGAIHGPGRLPHLPASEAASEQLARQVHPAIRAIQFQVSAAEHAVEQARGQGRPNLSVSLSANETFRSPNPALEGSNTQLALNFTQQIYRGGQVASLERAALAQVAATRASLSQQVLVNVQQVGNAYARLRIATAQIQASDQRIRAAQLAFDGVREEASLGARTTLDVLDAEQDLLEARISRIEAQTSLYVAGYSVLQAAGLLTVDYLDLNVPEYDVEAYGAAFPDGVPRVASPQGDRLDALLSRVGRD